MQPCRAIPAFGRKPGEAGHDGVTDAISPSLAASRIGCVGERAEWIALGRMHARVLAILGLPLALWAAGTQKVTVVLEADPDLPAITPTVAVVAHVPSTPNAEQQC